MTDTYELPPPDTASMAYSGRSVDYINGYEAGYEAAADQVRAAILAERERCAGVCEQMRAVSAVSYELGTACAAAIRAG
jgi:hypothetical protein